jgi:TolA-binding protein
MKRFYFLYIFLVIVFVGCGSVSSPSSMNSKSKKPTTLKQSTKKQINNKQSTSDTINQSVHNSPDDKIKSDGEHNEKPFSKKKSSIRFADTTSVDLEPLYAQKIGKSKNNIVNNYIDSLYNEGINYMDEGELDEAQAIFSTLTQTLLPGDSLYYEANFMEIECIISKNEISKAETLLKNLYQDKEITEQAYEKVLVRLGQIECVKANNGASKIYFDELKKKYPNSIYLKVANCNFLKHKK